MKRKSIDDERRVLELRASGMGTRKIAKVTGMCRNTVKRILRDAEYNCTSATIVPSDDPNYQVQTT